MASRGARHGRSEEQCVTIRQRCVYEKRKTNNSNLFLEDFRNKTPFTNRKWQLGERKKSADTWKTQRYENNWTCLTDGKRERPLGGRERHYSRLNNHAILLPIYQTRQRPLTAVELADMVSFTFFIIGWTGSQILVDFLQVGGLPLSYKKMQGVSLTGNCDSLVSDCGINSTPHFESIHTRNFLTRVTQAHIAVFFVCVASKPCISRACRVSHVA